jgi:hypothetical protein
MRITSQAPNGPGASKSEEIRPQAKPKGSNANMKKNLPIMPLTLTKPPYFSKDFFIQKSSSKTNLLDSFQYEKALDSKLQSKNSPKI